MACDKPISLERSTRERGTFGEELFDYACQRLTYSDDLGKRAAGGPVDVSGDAYRAMCRKREGAADAKRWPRATALLAERDRLVKAIDGAMPKPFLDKLEKALIDLLPLYDDGTFERGADALVKAFELLAEDGELHVALARLAERLGYRPIGPAALGAVRALAAYPRLPDFLDSQLRLIEEGGAAHAEFAELMRAAGMTLQAAQVQAAVAAPDRTLRLATALLLEEERDLPVGTRPERLLVRRDHRGLAQVEGRAGALPAPFVDRNADGLADADAMGNFVDAGGQPVAAPSPFPRGASDGASRDALGRALGPTGAPLYRYLDLRRTLVGVAAHEALEIADPDRDTALQLLSGTEAMLGARVMATRLLDDGSPIVYQGFDTQASPLLDLAHAFLQLLADPAADDALEVAEILFRQHARTTAAAIGAMLEQNERGKRHSEAVIDEDATFHDDLVEIIQRTLAVPGLGEDLMRALVAPETQELWPILADYFRHNDRIGVDPSTQAVTGAIGTPVDYGRPDGGFDRSLQQRLFHLIADSNGVSLCSKPGARVEVLGIGLRTYDNACDLFKIDDLAVFFIQSIAEGRDENGNLTGKPKAYLDLDLGWLGPLTPDSLIQTLSTIDGFTRNPTPEALARVLFLDPPPEFISNVQDPVICKDGLRFVDHHRDTIFAWEARPFYRAIRPIIQAFADHGAEKIFADATALMHRHWASRRSPDHQFGTPDAPGYAVGTGLVTYERLLDETFRGPLMPALVDLDRVILALELPGGRPALPRLTETTRYLFDPDYSPGLVPRNGECALRGAGNRCEARRGDGRSAGPYTPYLLLADAYKARRAAVRGGGAGGQDWQRATSTLVDQFLTVGATGFSNPRFAPTVARTMGFLRERVAAHRAAGDLEQWTRGRLPGDLEDALGSPVFAALVDFSKATAADPAARAELYALLRYLSDEVADDAAFMSSVSTAGDLTQMLLDDPNLVPVLRAVGRILDPEAGIVDEQVKFLRRAHDLDKGRALTELFKGMYVEHRPGSAPALDLVDILAEVHRREAGKGGRLAPEDYAAGFAAIAEFVGDEKRGLPRFIAIVKNRSLK